MTRACIMCDECGCECEKEADGIVVWVWVLDGAEGAKVRWDWMGRGSWDGWRDRKGMV